MNGRSNSATQIAWELASALFMNAKAECDKLEMTRDDAIWDGTFDSYYERREELLALPAPNVRAVIWKIEILWTDEIQSELPEGIGTRAIISDLLRLETRGAIK
ncbi:hypothetical protein [Novosphingobium sp.]|uniref:hypothetical protein n=1 Tax=Novosphingobium sp. TaxID=1874826 RepID=UPI003B5268CC